ncbi:helix-turn-helix transcriptional regulator [Bacillus sp. 1P02SD]|uniref:helix-turn-helix transcriptional regulator n=1 Tax=Bacillus sp. 1P02SD TaxID=3132264 RepID=UPI0039A2E400
MENSTIISTTIKLHYITDLNCYVLDEDGSYLYRQELVQLPLFMQETRDAAFGTLSTLRENQVYILHNEWDLQFFGYVLHDNGVKFCILLGPFYEKAPDFFKISREYHLNRSASEELRNVAKKISILTGEKINSFTSVLQQFRSLMDKTAPVVIDYTFKHDRNVSQTRNEEINQLELVELRYNIEKDFMRAVEMGNKKQALQLINSNNLLFSFAERFPNQPIRRVKNNLIVLNTLLRTAARRGQVASILVHRISEDYALKIEQVDQLGKLYQIEDQMIGDYCDLVQSHSLKQYSIIIQKVIEYVTSYYDQQLNIENLAEQNDVNVSHLSRKFKQETGYTITGFQQMLRINQAKFLLETENLTIEEISWMVGYDDPSYFTRVFKKETGMTPTQFRK